MALKPYLIAAISATIDLFAAYLLFELGYTPVGALMSVVALVGFVVAFVLWRRGR